MTATRMDVVAPSNALRSALTLGAACASSDTTLPVLTGVRIGVASGKLTVESTDRFRAMRVTVALSGGSDDAAPVWVPAKVIKAAARAITRRSISVALLVTDCSVTLPGLTLTWDADHGQWPDMDTIYAGTDATRLGQGITARALGKPAGDLIALLSDHVAVPVIGGSDEPGKAIMLYASAGAVTARAIVMPVRVDDSALSDAVAAWPGGWSGWQTATV